MRAMMVMRLLSAVLSVLLILQLGCQTKKKATDGAPRLILLYATCTVNKDYLSPYNAKVTYTPHLDRFANRSVVFERHMTESAQSGIAYASIYAGVQADKHGVYYHPRRLSEDLYLVTESFTENGYNTFFWSGHEMASSVLGYAQGVPKEYIVGPRRQIQASDVEFERILSKLKADPDYRAVIVAGFSVTHGPYNDDALAAFIKAYPNEAQSITTEEVNKYKKVYYENNTNKRHLSLNFPETVEKLGLTREEIDKLARVVELLYKSRINHLDKRFGEVVEKITEANLMSQSLIAFTADHGETLYRDNALFKWHHGGQLAPEALQVPLILHLPGKSPKQNRYGEVTRTIDIFPTLAGLSGLPIPETVEGVDLSGAIRGQRPPPKLTAWVHTSLIPPIVLREIKMYTLAFEYFSETGPQTMWVGLRDEDMVFKLRLMENGEWDFVAFDWKKDPTERNNLFQRSNPVHKKAVERLIEYKSMLIERYREKVYSPEGKAFDLPKKEALEKLRSLGYL